MRKGCDGVGVCGGGRGSGSGRVGWCEIREPLKTDVKEPTVGARRAAGGCCGLMTPKRNATAHPACCADAMLSSMPSRACPSGGCYARKDAKRKSLRSHEYNGATPQGCLGAGSLSRVLAQASRSEHQRARTTNLSDCVFFLGVACRAMARAVPKRAIRLVRDARECKQATGSSGSGVPRRAGSRAIRKTVSRLHCEGNKVRKMNMRDPRGRAHSGRARGSHATLRRAGLSPPPTSIPSEPISPSHQLNCSRRAQRARTHPPPSPPPPARACQTRAPAFSGIARKRTRPNERASVCERNRRGGARCALPATAAGRSPAQRRAGEPGAHGPSGPAGRILVAWGAAHPPAAPWCARASRRARSLAVALPGTCTSSRPQRALLQSSVRCVQSAAVHASSTQSPSAAPVRPAGATVVRGSASECRAPPNALHKQTSARGRERRRKRDQIACGRSPTDRARARPHAPRRPAGAKRSVPRRADVRPHHVSSIPPRDVPESALFQRSTSGLAIHPPSMRRAAGSFVARPPASQSTDAACRARDVDASRVFLWGRANVECARPRRARARADPRRAGWPAGWGNWLELASRAGAWWGRSRAEASMRPFERCGRRRAGAGGAGGRRGTRRGGTRGVAEGAWGGGRGGGAGSAPQACR